MRRENVFNAIEELGQALGASEIAEVLGQLMLPAASEELTRRRAAVLEALKRYTIASQSFSSPACELARLLRLSDLEDTGLWLEILSLGTAPERTLREWHQRITFVEDVLPCVAAMFRPEPLAALMESAGDDESVFTDDALLTVLVIERSHEYSTPERIVRVLESVSLLYRACAELAGTPANTLRVVACDSGVDKSFDFLGAKKAVELTVEILLSLWDSVVLHRGYKAAGRFDLIARDLPIVGRIEELKEHGKLAREQADLLRKRIIEGTSKFILAGAMIPDIERRSYSPRELMAPPPESSSDGEEEGTHGDGGNGEILGIPRKSLNLESLNEDERKTLVRLLEGALASAEDDREHHGSPPAEAAPEPQAAPAPAAQAGDADPPAAPAPEGPGREAASSPAADPAQPAES